MQERRKEQRSTNRRFSFCMFENVCKPQDGVLMWGRGGRREMFTQRCKWVGGSWVGVLRGREKGNDKHIAPNPPHKIQTHVFFDFFQFSIFSPTFTIP